MDGRGDWRGGVRGGVRRTGGTRRAALLTLNGAGALVLGACGGGQAPGGAGAGTPDAAGGAAAPRVTQPTTLVYWTNLSGADGAKMKELAERYQTEAPLVTVEQIQGVTPYFDKVLAAVAGGTPPDVLGTRMPYVPFLAESGVLADLSAREIQQLGLRADDFEPAVWRSGEWKGKRYSIPMDLNGHMLLYSAAAVRDLGGNPEQPPASWQDWQTWTTQLTRNEAHGTTFDYAGEALVVQLMHHLAQQGGAVFDPDGRKAAFNNPKGVAALTLLSEIYQRAALPLATPQGQGPLDWLEQRKLASWLNGPWNLNRLARPESPAAADLRIALAPQFDPRKPAWTMQGFQLTLPRQPKPDEARRGAAFALIGSLFGKAFEWSLAGKLPVSKRVLASDAFQKSTDPVITHLKLWEKYLPQAVMIESHPRWVDATSALHPELSKALKKELSPQSAIQEAERAVNAVLGA